MPPSTPNSPGYTTTGPSASPPACGCNAGWTWKRPGSATSITDVAASPIDGQGVRLWPGPETDRGGGHGGSWCAAGVCARVAVGAAGAISAGGPGRGRGAVVGQGRAPVAAGVPGHAG